VSICVQDRRLRCQVIQRRRLHWDGPLRGPAKGIRQNPKRSLGRLRIVGPERLKKGVGFVPYVFHEGLVPRGILARGLKVSPQALDEDQALASVVQDGLISHGSTEYALK